MSTHAQHNNGSAHETASTHDRTKRLFGLIRTWGIRILLAVVVFGLILFGFRSCDKKSDEMRSETQDQKKQGTRSASMVVQAAPTVSTALVLVTKPNDGNDATDSDWTVVHGRPHWFQCLDDLGNNEQQYQGVSGGWTSTIPADGFVKRWRYRSTTGTADEVRYHFDQSKCTTPVALG